MEQYLGKEKLKQCLDAMTLLDLIMTPPEKDWLRFTKKKVHEGIQWYTIDNGGGNDLIVLFFEDGIFIKGFDHENSLNQFAADDWDASFFEHIFSNVPDKMINILTEEQRDYTTFCMWYLYETGSWQQNEIEGNDGGKEYLLNYIRQTAKSLFEWASRYYEEELDFSIIQKLFDTGTLPFDEIIILNPECDANKILDEMFKE